MRLSSVAFCVVAASCPSPSLCDAGCAAFLCGLLRRHVYNGVAPDLVEFPVPACVPASERGCAATNVIECFVHSCGGDFDVTNAGSVQEIESVARRCDLELLKNR